MEPNYHGSTLTSRFLVAALPKVLYTGRNAAVFDDLLNFVSEEARHMFFTGVSDELANRGMFHAVLLHVSGDWPWLTDSGMLLRSYRNVQKHRRQSKPCVGVCHMCAAGKPQFDFEQINTSQPKWLGTMFTLDVFANGNPSPLASVPHPPGRTAELWFFDLFHTMHLGVRKAFLGSCLALLSEVEPGSNIDQRFSTMSDKYLSWCKSARQRPWVSKLTKELLGWTSTTIFPSGTWRKGALSTTLMKWVQDRFANEGDSWPCMLQEAGAACVACNSFLICLYNASAWIAPEQAQRISGLGQEFLDRYADLARQAVSEGKLLWVLQPQIHAMHHLVLYLLHSSRKGKVLNVLCMATQADEDFIGRPSRLSRRVTPKPLAGSRRVLERHLQSSYAMWVKDGYIRPSSSSSSGTAK